MPANIRILEAQLVTLGYSFRPVTILPLHPKFAQTIPRFKAKATKTKLRREILHPLHERLSQQYQLGREERQHSIVRIDRTLKIIEIHHVIPRSFMPVHEREFTFREQLKWWQDNVNNPANLVAVPTHDHDLIHDYLDAQNPYRPHYRADLGRNQIIRQGKRRPVEIMLPYREGRLWFSSHKPRRLGQIDPKYERPVIAIQPKQPKLPAVA